MVEGLRLPTIAGLRLRFARNDTGGLSMTMLGSFVHYFVFYGGQIPVIEKFLLHGKI